MMGRWVELKFELTREQSQTVTVTLSDEDLEDYEDLSDVDPWDFTDAAWDEADDRGGWSTDDQSVANAWLDDYGGEEDEEDEEDEEPLRQPEPLKVYLPGRLVIDGDVTVYEVESVTDQGYLKLLDVDTGEPTEDYGGRSLWVAGVSGADGNAGFYRWYRSGDHVIVHDGSHQTVVGASAGVVTLLNGQTYEWSQTSEWRWEEEVEQDEATA